MRGRVAVLLGGGVLAVTLLAGCGSGSSSPSTSSGPAQSELGGRAPAMLAPNGSGQSGASSGSGGSANSAGQATLPPVTAPGRQVVRTATISLTVADVRNTANTIAGIATGAGGFVGSADTEGDHSSLTLQVPQAKVDSVLSRLSGLGKVISSGQQAQDVTDQLVDVQSRIDSQRASVDRVRALLDRASSLGDVVSIEGELTKREADLESMEQRQAELASQVAMSTVTVQLSRNPAGPPVAAAASTGGFLGGLSGGWHAFLAALRVVLIVLGAVLPFGVGLGVPALVAVLLWRRRRAARQLPVAGTSSN